MSETRSGEQISAQIAKMGVIDGLQNGDFLLQSGNAFQIKNDGVQPVKLQVQLAGMDEGNFIETTFEIGWNPEIVKKVKATSLSGINLKWGY